jgi:GTP cyclohydrolase I
MPFEFDTDYGIDAIERVISIIGDCIERDGLLETPQRVLKSYQELFSGYNANPKDLFKTFDADGYDEMVVLHNIEFYSTCEHHLLPFFGTAHIGYIPNEKVIGVSKLARLLEIYSRRLQIQERITTQITQALDSMLLCKGSACVLQARHLCCSARGIGKQSAIMTTSSMTGAFKRDASTRSEFLSLIRSQV